MVPLYEGDIFKSCQIFLINRRVDTKETYLESAKAPADCLQRRRVHTGCWCQQSLKPA